MRVHELAKKIAKTAQELIAELEAGGVKVKSHMSLVPAEVAERYLKKSETKAPSPPKTIPVSPAPGKISTPAIADKKPQDSPTPRPDKQSPRPADPDAKKTEVVRAPSVDIKSDSKPNPETEPQSVSAPVSVATPAPISKKPVPIEMPICVGVLAEKLNVRVPELIKSLIGIGVFANVNQLLNEELVWKAAKALGIEIEKLEDVETKIVLEGQADDPSSLKLRPPIVTMMGHVDHGKTSLLDAIRKTSVAQGEVGQITQHIGAYMVDIHGKGKVTFLDTPGHQAFTAMRARGANVTDIVVLVVAADDGVKPQTVEAVDHAKAAGCPILVAINKCDLPAANPQRAMQDLQKLELMPEEWGGKTICSKVSAKTGKGIEELLEILLLQAEIMELKANPNRSPEGIVLEARLTKGRGNIATVIVQKGTLRVGDLMIVGPYYGKVRALANDRGKSIKEAGPSSAVEVLGLPGTPEAGDVFVVVHDEKIARKICEKRQLEIREKAMKGLHPKHLSLEELYGKVKEGRVKELRLIVKADVQGSVEALSKSLQQTENDQIKVRILHAGVGGINESDIMLAAASDAVVIGFHVKTDERAAQISEKEGVDVRLYGIIYEAIDDVRKAMEGLLAPTFKEVVEGRTLIRQVFSSSKIGTIGGAYVQKGKLLRNHKIRVIRDNIVVHEGKLSSLKRFKDDVREVAEGYDCGVVVEGFDRLQAGDVIESFRVERVAGKLAAN